MYILYAPYVTITKTLYPTPYFGDDRSLTQKHYAALRIPTWSQMWNSNSLVHKNTHCLRTAETLLHQCPLLIMPDSHTACKGQDKLKDKESSLISSPLYRIYKESSAWKNGYAITPKISAWVMGLFPFNTATFKTVKLQTVECRNTYMRFKAKGASQWSSLGLGLWHGLWHELTRQPSRDPEF